VHRQRRPSAHHAEPPDEGRTWPHQERAHDADARAAARRGDVKPDGVARGRVSREGAGHAGALACHLARALARLRAA